MSLLSIDPPANQIQHDIETRTGDIRGLHVVLLKPSKYDDDGYVLRHWRGVLPSNTMACLYGLTEDVKHRQALRKDLDISIELLDEAVQKINVAKIVRRSQRPGWKTVVCLAGVQTNQYPRAIDLAREFRAAGLTVIIGGFHVSGTLALFHSPTPDIQEILDLGVTVVSGEVEEHWEALLRDALLDELKPMYNYLDPTPDLHAPPIPMINKKYLNRFAYKQFGTIDCGRGCPFSCSFCSIINVQGRKMRMRNPESIAHAIKENYERSQISFYFFTDDNFARNKKWREIFEAIIRLQETDGITIEFIMQVDVLSYKIKDFISLARQAGCTQVFIGMESINDDNLEAADKNQNDSSDYRNLIDAWHAAEITTHVGFIIGFPFDTFESIKRDVQRLQEEIQVDQASFFMLTPIPGSMDHFNAVKDGVPIDADLNLYDSFHPTMDHPNMTRDAVVPGLPRCLAVVLQLRQHEGHPDARHAAHVLERLQEPGVVQERRHSGRQPPDDDRLFPPQGPHGAATGHGHRQPLAVLALARSRGAGLSEGDGAFLAGAGGVVAADPQAQRARAAPARRSGADSRRRAQQRAHRRLATRLCARKAAGAVAAAAHPQRIQHPVDPPHHHPRGTAAVLAAHQGATPQRAANQNPLAYDGVQRLARVEVARQFCL